MDGAAARITIPTPAPPTAAPAPGTSTFVVVSNRLPPRATGGRKQNVGGLVSGLRPALASREGLWLGWDAGRADDDAPPDGLEVDAAGTPPRGALHLPSSIAERYYTGFCNGVLWPFLHGMLDKVKYDDDAWAAYVEANERFADAILRVAAPDATVWIHDYHLMLAATALRRRGFEGRLGFFLHVPFPAAEIVETLPRSQALLEALARHDLVGFHTARYARNFVEAASELTDAEPLAKPDRGGRGALALDGRRCDVGVFPIGIDPAAYAPTSDVPHDDEVESLRRSLRGRKLVLGVDRLDYTKGICERLAGFERLLRVEPSWRGKVSLVQIAVPSREDVPEYQEQRARVESLVGRINGEHGETDWVPVRYLYRSYAPAELARLYRMASVALVTPLRDGMNLVAKEFVAAQDPADPGVLVLSRFAGAAAELGRGALLTNPLHADGLARDIDRALRMEHMERRVRHAICLEPVVTNTAAAWCSNFLRALEER